jgi:hypothetical protein
MGLRRKQLGRKKVNNPLQTEGVERSGIKDIDLNRQEVLVNIKSREGRSGNQFLTSLNSFMEFINRNVSIPGVTTTIVETSSPYTASSGDQVWADASGGDFTVTFPSAVLNREVLVINVGTSGIVTASAGVPLDGASTTFDLFPGESLTWKCNGTKWIGY